MTAVQEIEHALSDIEQRIDIPFRSPSAEARIRLYLYSFDLKGLSLLLAAVAPHGAFESAILQAAPHCSLVVPALTLRWCDTAALTVVIRHNAKLHPTPSMKEAGIDDKALKDAAAAGVLEMGAKYPRPWKVDDPASLLACMVEMICGGWSGHISSLTIAAPTDRLRQFDVVAGPVQEVLTADVMWVMFPPRELSADETTGLRSKVRESDVSAVFPFLDIPEPDEAAKQEGGNGRYIEKLIRALPTTIPERKSLTVFPALPIRTPAQEGHHNVAGYMRECMDLAWGATLLTGGETSAMRRVIDKRLETVLDAALSPPSSICRLLRQKKALTQLQSLPELESTPPQTEPFQALQARGIASFAAESAASAQQAAAAQHEQRRQRTETLLEFLTPLKTAVADIDTASDTVSSIIEDVSRNGVSDDEDGLERVAGSLDAVFEDALACIGRETAACEKEMKESSPDKAAVPPAVLRDEAEAAERHEYTWGTLIRLGLEKVKLKKPDQEIRQIIAEAREDFLDYLNLTPADEKEFDKCLTAKWPGVAKKYSKKMHTLMEDTCQLWEIAINQELDNIEEYRREHSPRSPKFPVDIVLQARGMPSIAERLDVKLKKPALKAKLFDSREKGLWRSETIMTIQKSAEGQLRDYESATMTWFGTINEQIDQVKQRVIVISDRIVEAGKKAVEKKARERNDRIQKRRKQQEQCASWLDELTDRKQAIESFRDTWADIRERLYNTEIAT